MEKSTKIKLLAHASRLTAFVCFCLALALVLFPAAPGAEQSVAASASVQISAAETARVERRAAAQSGMLIPLGRTTGIKMFSEGAMVVSFSESGGSPAREAGLKAGDVIVALNDEQVKCNEDLTKHLAQLKSGEFKLTVLRDGERMTFDVKAERDEQNETWRIGAWVRDSIAGIGTITFVDPQNGAFGALGHGISDSDTGRLMRFDNGSIMESTVVGVTRGQPGSPGELTGSFNLRENQGVLYSNTERGIFGRITEQGVYQDRQALPIAAKSEIKTGKAQILSNVQGDLVEQFDVEIIRVYPGTGEGTRDMMVQITDERLINITGGIVQGMSGSPIIQNGKLIGAVTHVLINDPTRGYGISIENMLAGAAA